MCGRYTITVTLEELLLRYWIDPDADLSAYRPRFNVKPTESVPVVVHDGQRNRIGMLRWGLIPERAADAKETYLHARAETAAVRRSFRIPFERKRCVIPADGYVDWHKGSRQPMRVTLRSGSVFSMAGLYDTWISPDGRKVGSFAILTCDPNPLLAELHDRMPVILRPEDEAEWLNRGVYDRERLQSLLRPYPVEEMRYYPVTSLVGKAGYDDPECIRDLTSAEGRPK